MFGRPIPCHPVLWLFTDATRLPDPRAGLWNQAFGAATTWADVTTVADAVAFFHRGRDAAGQLEKTGGQA